MVMMTYNFVHSLDVLRGEINELYLKVRISGSNFLILRFYQNIFNKSTSVQSFDENLIQVLKSDRGFCLS